MTEETVLKAKQQIAMADSAIAKLKNDIANLSEVSNSFSTLMNSDAYSSGTISKIKEISNDYITAIGACITANEIDIKDLEILKSRVGKKDYIGKDILGNKNKAYASYEKNKKKYDKIWNTIENNDWWQVVETDAELVQLAYYKGAYELDYREYKKWKAKEEAFDAIEENTRSLFQNSDRYRVLAEKGFKALKKCHDGPNFSTDYDRKWAVNLSAQMLDSIAKYKEQWIKKNGELDWDAIEIFLDEDPANVTSMEYLAFAEIIDGMSTDDLNILFGEVSKTDMDYHDVLNYKGGDISEILTNAIDVYWVKSGMEAEMTIFNSEWKGTEAKRNEISDRLTKSSFLYNLYNKMTVDTQSHSVTITKADGVYTGEISHTDNYGRMVGAFISKETLVVSPIERNMAEASHEGAKIKLQAIMPSSSLVENWGDWTVATIRDSVIAACVNTAEGIVYADAVSWMNKIIDDQQKLAAISSACDQLDLELLCDSLAISGVCVDTSGPVNSVHLDHAKFDNKRLTIYVYAYNKKNNKNITVKELKESAAKNGTEYKEYMKWYNKDNGKNSDIPKYNNKIAVKYGELMEKNSKFTTDFEDLTVEQIEELIKKVENDDYEINLSLWEKK